MPNADTRNVLFVCWGNICRSPAAEGVLRHLIAEQGLEGRIEADSAGTIDYHAGDPADARMRAAAAARGYALESISRPFVAGDFERYDLIVAMDRKNLRDVRSLEREPQDHVRLFSEFLPDGTPVDVPDPYLGEAGFERTLDIIERGCPAILEHLLHEA